MTGAGPVRGLRQAASDGAWVIAGNGAWSGLQYLIILLLVRFEEPALVGAYTLGHVVSNTVFVVTNAGLRESLATDIRRENPAWRYFDARLSLTLLACIAVALYCAGRFTASGGAALAVAFLLPGLLRAVVGLSDVRHGAMQRAGALRGVGLSMVFKTVAGAGAMAIGVIALGEPLAGVALTIATTLLVMLSWDRPRAARCAGPEDAAGVGGFTDRFIYGPALMLRRHWTLSLSSGLQALSHALPVILLDAIAGPAAAGVFAPFFFLFAVAALFLNSAVRVFASRLARMIHNDQLALFRRRALQFTAFVMAVTGAGACVIWLLQDWLYLALDVRRSPQTELILALVLAAMVARAGQGALQTVQLAMRTFGRMAWVTGSSAASSLIASVLLVPASGAAGAAASLLFGAIAAFLVTAVLFTKAVRKDSPKFRIDH